MRKITRESIEAFLNGRNFNKGNMKVEVVAQESTRLLLHGNQIAYKNLDGEIFISNAGWESNTTKERLNGLIKELELYDQQVYQKDFVWYWKDGKEFPYDQFVKVV